MVFELVRIGLGEPQKPDFIDWAIVNWLRVISLSDFHHVLPVVSTGLGRIAKDKPELKQPESFLKHLSAAQIAREAKACKELSCIVNRLNREGIVPIMLKGGAFFAEKKFEPVNWRFMSDVDLLLSPERALLAFRILLDYGYAPAETAYYPDEDNHYPALIREDSILPIEVHTRVLAHRSKIPLGFKKIESRATQVTFCGKSMLIPCREDRLIHLIAHGMVASHQYRRRHIVLREVLDFHHLTQDQSVDLDNVRRIFAESGHEKELCSFIDFVSFALGRPAACSNWAGKHQIWVNETLEALSSPSQQIYWTYLDGGKLLIRSLVSVSGWRRLLRVFTNPDRRRSLWKSRIHYYFYRYRSQWDREK